MNELQKHLEEIRDNSPRWLCYDGPEGYEWPKSYEEYKKMVNFLQETVEIFGDEIKMLKKQVVELASKRDK